MKFILHTFSFKTAPVCTAKKKKYFDDDLYCSIKLLKTYSCHGLKASCMPTVTQLCSVPQPHVFSQYVALLSTSSLCTV